MATSYSTSYAWIQRGEQITGDPNTPPTGGTGSANRLAKLLETNLEYLRIRGDVDSPWLEVESKTISFTALANYAYIVTVANNISVSLPAAPAINDYVRVKVDGGDLTRLVVIDGNGWPVGDLANITVKVDNQPNVLLKFSGTRWIIEAGSLSSDNILVPDITGATLITLTQRLSDLGGTPLVPQTTSFAADPSSSYSVNSTGGPITATLPASPPDGTRVEFMDSVPNFGTNPLTIDRNGATIEGIANDMILSRDNEAVALVFEGGNWIVASDGRHATSVPPRIIYIAADITQRDAFPNSGLGLICKTIDTDTYYQHDGTIWGPYTGEDPFNFTMNCFGDLAASVVDGHIPLWCIYTKN